VQKLLETINWVRPLLGLTTTQLTPLFQLLKSDKYLLSPQSLTKGAQTALREVEKAIETKQAYCLTKNQSLNLYVVINLYHALGLLGQWNTQWKDPLHFI
ncbi:POK25 protein, partial [Scytalopus superciliaris]|nr:POK25 protein [Scytalopus superciliaris]